MPKKIKNLQNEVENGGMSEEEMRKDLEKDFADLKSKDESLRMQAGISKNSIKQLKIDTLKNIFAMLEDYGVDPSDLESINRFLESLREQDPDLLVLFETAINALSPEVAQPEESSGSNMVMPGIQGAMPGQSPAMSSPMSGSPSGMPDKDLMGRIQGQQ